MWCQISSGRQECYILRTHLWCKISSGRQECYILRTHLWCKISSGRQECYIMRTHLWCKISSGRQECYILRTHFELPTVLQLLSYLVTTQLKSIQSGLQNLLLTFQLCCTSCLVYKHINTTIFSIFPSLVKNIKPIICKIFDFISFIHVPLTAKISYSLSNSIGRFSTL